MDRLEGLIRADPARPRLVVTYQTPDGGSRFQWGVVGAIPILTLLGRVARVQAELLTQSDGIPDSCESSALVILFDQDNQSVGAEHNPPSYFVHPGIPVEPLVGMLETVKCALVGSRAAQGVAAQQVQICGPDGNPIWVRHP